MKQGKKNKIDSKALMRILIILAAIALVFQLESMVSDIRALEKDVGEIKQIYYVQQSLDVDEILSNLLVLDETKDYPRADSVEVVSAQSIKALAETQPVIYKDLPDKALYRIVLSNDNAALFVIYDFEENKVLRSFVLDQMQFGQ